MGSSIIVRGDIFMVNLPDRDGSVQGGIRPAIVTSNDYNNKYCNTVNVVPLTSQLSKANYPMHVAIGVENGVDRESVALCEQETTINKNRLLTYIGHCTEQTIKRLEKGIMIQKGISDPFNITRVKRLITAIKEASSTFSNDSYVVQTLKLELSTYCKQYGKTIKGLANTENNKIKQYA